MQPTSAQEIAAGASRLWRQPMFLSFWAAQTISVFGSQITLLAIPLTASLTLGATPVDMAWLVTAGGLPLLLVSLFAGVIADRGRRKTILIGADLGRAALLLAIPLAAWFGVLRLELLYIITFLVGILGVFFDVTAISFLPEIIRRDNLVEGNSRLESSRAASEIAGPGLAGVLIQMLGAPLAIVVDAASFLASALLLGGARQRTAAITTRLERPNVLRDIEAGLRYVLGQPILRANVTYAAILNLSETILEVVYLLALVEVFRLTPSLIGIIYATGNIGFLAGALSIDWIVKTLGLGRTLLNATLLASISMALVLCATGPLIMVIPVLIVARVLNSFAATIYTITHVSVRQRIAPASIQGRVNASVRFIAGGVVPIGGAIGGLAGTQLGLVPTIAIATLGTLIGAAWIWLSPVRSLKSIGDFAQPMAEQ